MTKAPTDTVETVLPDADFEDASTLVEDARFGLEVVEEPEVPALPVPLLRRAHSDDAWLQSLPETARSVLESAREAKRPWPYSERVVGAVAQPLPPRPKSSSVGA